MADPLSITASVLAVLGATKIALRGIRCLRSLWGASQKLDDLLAEIWHFDILLQTIRWQSWSSNEAIHRFEILLSHASKELTAINALVEYQLTEPGQSTKVDHRQWARREQNVEKARNDLRDCKLDLIALIGVETR